MAKKYRSTIVGLDYEDRESRTVGLERGHKLILLREPDNPYDSNAICVVRRGYSKVGYLPRSLTAKIAAALDNAGGIAIATVDEVTGWDGGPDKRGVTIKFEVPEWNSSDVMPRPYGRIRLSNGPETVALSANNQWLALAFIAHPSYSEPGPGWIEIWQTWPLILKRRIDLDASLDELGAIALSAFGDQVAIYFRVGDSSGITVWEAPSGKHVATVAVPGNLSNLTPIRPGHGNIQLAFLDDMRRLILTIHGEDFHIMQWNILSWNRVLDQRTNLHRESSRPPLIYRDGTVLWCHQSEHTADLCWTDPASMQIVRQLRVKGKVTGIYPGGQYLVTVTRGVWQGSDLYDAMLPLKIRADKAEIIGTFVPPTHRGIEAILPNIDLFVGYVVGFSEHTDWTILVAHDLDRLDKHPSLVANYLAGNMDWEVLCVSPSGYSLVVLEPAILNDEVTYLTVIGPQYRYDPASNEFNYSDGPY